MKQTRPTTNGRWYCEWASDVYRRAGCMVTSDRISAIAENAHRPGYRSLYWFDEQDAQAIIANGHSAGMAAFVPASDFLLIDLDDGDASLPGYRRVLEDQGLGYELWSSGGKGYHLVIAHAWHHDQRLPYSQRCFVESLGLDFDASLYQPGRLISLPRRLHKKTGRRKRLLETIKGKPLELQLVTPPTPAFALSGGDSDEALARGLMAASMMTVNPPPHGGRHLAIWRCAKDLLAGGLEVEVVEEMLITVNNTWDRPKRDSEVIRAVRGAL